MEGINIYWEHFENKNKRKMVFAINFFKVFPISIQKKWEHL